MAGAGAAEAGSGAAELEVEGEVEAATAGSSAIGAVTAGSGAAGAAADGSTDGSFEFSRDAMRPLRRVGAIVPFGALVAFLGGMVMSVLSVMGSRKLCVVDLDGFGMQQSCLRVVVVERKKEEASRNARGVLWLFRLAVALVQSTH